MLCNMCNERDAVLIVQQVSLDNKKEVHLCPVCAKDRGLNVSSDNNDPSVEKLINSISTLKKRCYVCGKSIDDIRKSGMLGCAECYVAFNDDIKDILLKTNKEASYSGSMPKKLEHFRSILTDRIEIQKKLDASIEQEDFEKAAMYRDFLKALERPSISGAEEGEQFDR